MPNMRIRRLFLAVCSVVFLSAFSVPARAQAPNPTPTPEIFKIKVAEDGPRNMISGTLLPLLIVNVIGLEYERVIHPALGGIALRSHFDYVFLGIVDIAGFGFGAHYVYYLPIDLGELDKNVRISGAPAGPFIGAGMDFTIWQGRYFGPGPYEANVRGTSVEPNFYGGYRIVLEHLFIAPRAGMGFAVGGARYRDNAGNRQYYSRGHNFELHFDLVVGIAW